MFVGRYGDTLRVDAPAKLNLFLEVISRRLDGFHEIETLMTPISVFDSLFLRTTPAPGIRLHCTWASGLRFADRESYAPVTLPPVEENLVFKALTRLAEEASVTQGAEVHLLKRIPAAAGLGGASSDAAAALLAANIAWNLNLPRARLQEIAATLGSDIPFFFYGATAICRGRGEQVECLPTFPRLPLVVVKPPVGLSTPKIYGGCQVTQQPVGIQSLQTSAATGNICELAAHMKNDLEASACVQTPWIEKLRGIFDDLSFVGHQMSGSGSSYFGICRTPRHAQRLANILRSRRVGRVMQATTCHQSQPA